MINLVTTWLIYKHYMLRRDLTTPEKEKWRACSEIGISSPALNGALRRCRCHFFHSPFKDSSPGHRPAPTAPAVAFSTAIREREWMAETSMRSFPALTPEEERLKIRDISLAAESQSKEGDTFYLITQRFVFPFPKNFHFFLVA